jgi:hypothetical protein
MAWHGMAAALAGFCRKLQQVDQKWCRRIVPKWYQLNLQGIVRVEVVKSSHL